jgi:hypothetical protein
MKILWAPTAIARTRPFVCHELAGVELTAPAVAGHTATTTSAATITRTGPFIGEPTTPLPLADNVDPAPVRIPAGAGL